MFRPVRIDTPRGKAAQKLQLGQLCVFVFTPCNAMVYLMGGLTERDGIRPLLEDPWPVFSMMIAVPSITLLLGLMFMYEGWWNLRKLT